jgi:hypothetical protein
MASSVRFARHPEYARQLHLPAKASEGKEMTNDMPGEKIIEPSTMDFGDTPDSVIEYCAALNTKIAELETEVFNLNCVLDSRAQSPAPDSGEREKALEVIVDAVNEADGLIRAEMGRDVPKEWDTTFKKVVKARAALTRPAPPMMGEDEFVELMMQTDRGKTFEETYKNQYKALQSAGVFRGK